MNKKLIALAVAGATFAPAVMAQSANPVTLYGRIWVMANSVKATVEKSTMPSRANTTSSNPDSPVKRADLKKADIIFTTTPKGVIP